MRYSCSEEAGIEAGCALVYPVLFDFARDTNTYGEYLLAKADIKSALETRLHMSRDLLLWQRRNWSSKIEAGLEGELMSITRNCIGQHASSM